MGSVTIVEAPIVVETGTVCISDYQLRSIDRRMGLHNTDHACIGELTAAGDDTRLLEGSVKVSVGCVIALEMGEMPI